MSTTPITNLGSVISNGGDPSQAYDQADAPPAPSIPQADPATLQSAATGGVAQATQAPPSGSRLGAIVQAVAKVASTALSGIPDQGRPSFVTGLGQGARAEQAARATQAAIKFKTFDDQVRLAQLHNQDLKLQNDTQAQTDAHKKAELDNRALANSLGIDYDTIPSDGKTVMDHLTAQTAMNGSASVPPGTHLSGDGETINIPKDTQATRDGQKQMYQMLSPALALPSLPPGAQFVPDKAMNMLTNVMHGFQPNGQPYKHDDLIQVLAAGKTLRDQLAKNGASPQQLQALDNRNAILQANKDALDEHAQTVADAASQRKIAENKATAEVKGEQTRETNAAKPQKPQSDLWVQGATADEKKKAELGENIAENSNAVAQMLLKRPNLVGAVAGRFTSAEQMMGNNDPDIAALGTRIHNIAMANSGVHGFRSQEGVESFERQVLNNFRNGPQAVAGALKATTGSVQTFIDNARPDTYRTHSKNGGALRGMMGVQQ